MTRCSPRRWLPVFLVILGLPLGLRAEARTTGPALVLTAFGWRP
jgi:hypothetical protein